MLKPVLMIVLLLVASAHASRIGDASQDNAGMTVTNGSAHWVIHLVIRDWLQRGHRDVNVESDGIAVLSHTNNDGEQHSAYIKIDKKAIGDFNTVVLESSQFVAPDPSIGYPDWISDCDLQLSVEFYRYGSPARSTGSFGCSFGARLVTTRLLELLQKYVFAQYKNVLDTL